MIRRPPRSTQGVSSAASDVYKRQVQMNAAGRPTTEYEYRAGKEKDHEVEIIHWHTWFRHTMGKTHSATVDKSLLMAAVMDVWDTFPTPPIAFVRQQGKLMCKTTEAVKQRELVVPLFFRNYGSLRAEQTDAARPHPMHVEAEVTWPVSEKENKVGSKWKNILSL